jgi:hypothetical protein
MNILTARIKATGEVVEVERYAKEQGLVFFRPPGVQRCLSTIALSQVELILDGYNSSEKDWGKMCSEIARAIFLQTLQGCGMSKQSADALAESAVYTSARFVRILRGAVAKFEELKGGIERSEPNRADSCDEYAVLMSAFESIINICNNMDEHNRENLTATIKCHCNDAIEYYHKWVDKKGSYEKENNN